MRAEVVDRRVAGAVEEHRHEATAHLEAAPLAYRDVTCSGHGGVGDVVGHHRVPYTIMFPGELPPSPLRTTIRLLVLDVDGTLTDSRHEVPPETRAAVARIRAAGITVALATGRRYRDVLPVAQGLGIDQPLVTASGGLVKRARDHATLYAARFATGVLGHVLATITARGLEPVVYTDSFAAGHDFHCRRLPPEGTIDPAGLDSYLVRNRHLADLRADLVEVPPEDAFAGFAMGPREALLELETALDEACPGQLSLHTIRSPRYRDWMCEFAPAAVTKWSGALRLAEALEIPAAAICAVGDDVNDLPMIRGAGLGIAMGNATPEVRAAADRVVATSDCGGLADVADLLLADGQPSPSSPA